MKSYSKTALLSIIIFMFSCTENNSYYSKITAVKSIDERLQDLNKSLTEVRKSEKKSALVKEDEDYLEFEYEIGEAESYKTTYFFDSAGCYEVGLDTYFLNVTSAQEVLDGIISVFNKNGKFEKPTNSSSLYEWASKDGLFSAELDYVNLDKGMISLTIFANQ